MKNNVVLANSADPDEMLCSESFYLGLHYFQNYPIRGFSLEVLKTMYTMSLDRKLDYFRLT